MRNILGQYDRAIKWICVIYLPQEHAQEDGSVEKFQI